MWIEFKKWCSHARKNVGEKRWANGDGVGWWMGTLIPQRFEKRHQKLLSANALIIKLNFHGWEKTKNDIRILFAVNKCMVWYWTEISTNNLIGTKPKLHKRITIMYLSLSWLFFEKSTLNSWSDAGKNMGEPPTCRYIIHEKTVLSAWNRYLTLYQTHTFFNVTRGSKYRKGPLLQVFKVDGRARGTVIEEKGTLWNLIRVSARQFPIEIHYPDA